MLGFQTLSGAVYKRLASCLGTEGFGSLCDCSNSASYFYYLDADTVAEKKTLVWVPRASDILSALCSVLIVAHVIRTHGKQYTVYHGLMMSMSVYDIAGSIAWALSTYPIPVYDEFGFPTGIYGAHGSEASCTAQGFSVQLGYTGIFYNMALSFYYLLVIRYGWREDRLQKVKVLFHGIPLLFGWGLAFAGIPFYELSYWGCWILPEPGTPRFARSLIFFIVPLMIVLVLASINMLLVYMAVRRQDRKGIARSCIRWNELFSGSACSTCSVCTSHGRS